MPRSTTLHLGTLIAVLCAACGPVPRPRPASEADLLDVHQARALELIYEVAADLGVSVSTGWSIDVGADEPFVVDVRVADTSYGVEWVSPQDRVDHGELLPDANPRQLQLMPGGGGDAQAQVLIIDHGNYRYDRDLERVQRGARGAREAESSIQNYVRDYFEYVRGQGAI